MNCFTKDKINWSRAAKNLRRAAALLEKNGWVHGSFSSGQTHCVVGAINKIVGCDDSQGLSQFEAVNWEEADFDELETPIGIDEYRDEVRLMEAIAEAEMVLLMTIGKLAEDDTGNVNLATLEGMVTGWNDHDEHNPYVRNHKGEVTGDINEGKLADSQAKIVAALRSAALMADQKGKTHKKAGAARKSAAQASDSQLAS